MFLSVAGVRWDPMDPMHPMHSGESASRGQKYQTWLILFSRPRRANFAAQFPRKREETAEETASRSSLLSSFSVRRA